MPHHCRPPAPCPRHKSRHPPHPPAMRRGGVLPRPITGALLVPLRRGDPRGRPREGKSAKRRQWRMKRAGFEEVPRLAGTTVPVSRLARRWAREPLPYAPQGTHRAGRTGSSAPTTLFVGADAYIGPTGFSHIPGRARGPCPTKNTIVGRDPCVPPSHRTPCKKPVIARPARTLVVAIRSPCPRATARVAPTLPLSAFHFQLNRKAVSPCHENSPSLSWPFSALLPWQRVCAFPAPGR